MTRRLTIQDVADRVGLSKFSVSRALSGKPGVGAATRARVMRTASLMGYGGENAPAAATRQILFVRQAVDPVSSELWQNVMFGAEREAERHGLAVVPRLAASLPDPARLGPEVAGLILAMPRSDAFSAALAASGLPAVCASYAKPMERIDQVAGTDWESGNAVAALLLGLGHRRMAFVHGEAGLAGRAERLRGFRDGVAAVPEARVDDLKFDEAVGCREALLAYLAEGAAPTALFCAHDGIAVHMLSELLRMGVRVPRDVSIVGFNDFVCATQVSPRLTTMRTPQTEIGATMVRCLAERLSGAEAAARPPMRVALLATLVQRDSTGPAGDGSWPRYIMPGLPRSVPSTSRL